MASAGGHFRALVVGTITGPVRVGVKKNPNGTARMASARLTIERWTRHPITKVASKNVYWMNLLFLGRSAETMNTYGYPGTRMYASGHLEQKMWTDRQGCKHLDYELVVDEFQFLDRKERPDEATMSAQEASKREGRKHQPPRYQGAF